MREAGLTCPAFFPSRSSSPSQFHCSRASVLPAPRLGGSGLLSVFFLLCGFSLFGFLLSLPFGLVLLAFLVAHMITPFRRSQLSILASARSGHPCPSALPAILGTTHILLRCCRVCPTVECPETVPISALKCLMTESVFTSLMIPQNISTVQFRKKESFTIWFIRARLLSVARLRG